MRIDNKEFLNPQQQLYQNTKDIEKLKADYQPVYSYEGLIDSTIIHTVNRSSTNVPAGVNIGWLMDYTGKLFKITDGSSTTLLIDYYAQIKGPKGDTGNTGPQGPQGPQGIQGPQGEPGQATIGIEVVAELPATGEEGVIYFVPKQDSETGDEYEEYTYVNNDWELLGGATVDLTNYALKSELPVIDEDLIPKAFNTYVLGDNTHSYKEVVANKFKSPNSYYEMSGVNVSGHGAVIIKTTDGNGTDEGKLQLNNIALYCNKNIAPLSGSTVNLGQAANGFNNLYLDGKIVSDDNLSYGLALPDTTSFTADKTIATTDQIPTLPNYNITNVITDNSEVLGMQIYNTSADISYNIHNTTANPTLAGTESNLTSIDIGGTAYAIPSGGGTTVVANPTLDDTESNLTSITIGSTSYKIPDTTNLVTTNTDQTISGIKTFSRGTIIIPYNSRIKLNYQANNMSFIQLGIKGAIDSGTGSSMPTFRSITSGTFDAPNFATRGVEFPDTSTYANNKVLATTDQIGAYITTAPSAANTDGTLHIVVLTSEPSTYYSGYIYYITEA